MADIVLVRNKEEARVFAQKFEEDLAVLVKSRTVDGVCCGLNEQTIMQKALLWHAGFIEGMRQSGLEIVQSLGKLRPHMAYMLERESADDIYAFYTDGVNHGIRSTDEHRAESTERIARQIEFEEGATDTAGAHAHLEEKKEEVK